MEESSISGCSVDKISEGELGSVDSEVRLVCAALQLASLLDQDLLAANERLWRSGSKDHKWRGPIMPTAVLESCNPLRSAGLVASARGIDMVR